MRYHLFTGILFAVMIFLIPLFALNQKPETIQQLPMKLPAVQVNPPEDAINPEPAPLPTAPVITLEQGDFRLLDEKTGKIITVNTTDYLRGVVAAEMPPTFHAEALEAQAVASHTYAVYVQQQNQLDQPAVLKGADFTVDIQSWKGFTTEAQFRERYGDLADAYWKTICDAADDVSTYLLTYEEQPIVAAYHSMSTGVTEDASNVWTGSKPYLVPVESRGDTLAPDYNTKTSFQTDALRTLLLDQIPGLELGDDPSDWFHVNQRSEGGYITELAVGNQIIHGKTLRTILDLRSTDFTVAYANGTVTFTTKGYGHGVGLSQYGADYLARQGKTFDEILLHYYSGANLSMISPS